MAKNKTVKKPVKKSDTLNPKQLRFCQEYILCGENGKLAATKAGYSPLTADVQASRLLTHVNVLKRIEELKEAVAKQAEEKFSIDTEWVMSRFKMISDRCVQDVPVMRFDYESKSMVQATMENDKGEEVGVYQFDASGANKATEMLGKMIGAFEIDNKQRGVKISVSRISK